MKTNKAAKKRLRVTKRKKVMHRHTNQNHFNAKDTGEETRHKREETELRPALKKKVLEQYLPNS